MPTLDWIGKRAVVNHHRELPYRLLHCDPTLGAGDPAAGNLLVEGDNLHALKALLPYYAGRVKCIYIDPPYNTGNEGWVYNDNVTSPEIQKWLGDTVGKEAEDLSRHDKWLCMMYPRLALLQEFLTEDGAIFISIDDNEVQNLRGVMDEIFGRKNFVATVIWQKMDGPKNTAIHLSEDHDYIVVYARDANVWRPNKLARSEEMIGRYKNPDSDPRGPWLLSDLAARNAYSLGRYPITTRTGRVIEGPPAGSYWRVSKEKFDELDRDNRIWWGKSGANRPGIKRFLTEVQAGVVPQTLWFWKEVGSTRNAKQEFSRLMEAETSTDLFITPKPTALIKRIAQLATNPGDLILDSFAGSGTTGHAILALNVETAKPTESEEKGDLFPDPASTATEPRRFILCEIESKIAREITSERLRRVISGNGETPCLGGGFRFCTLGEPMLNEEARFHRDVSWSDLGHHLWFAETGEPWSAEYAGAPSSQSLATEGPMLGVAPDGRAIYLLHSNLLRGQDGKAANVLTPESLAQLAPHAGPRVVYGEACTLRASALSRERIVFKQIPYQVRQQ